MLFDPKWDIDSLQSLIAWLEEQDPDGAYEYRNSLECLLCRYYRAKGVRVWRMQTCEYSIFSDSEVRKLPRHFNAIAVGDGELWSTFGAALERARKIAAHV